MSRIAPIPPVDYTAEQRRLHEQLTKQRTNGIRGPFEVLMHVPEILGPMANFIDQLLLDTRVPHNLKEFAILAIARKYGAQFEWFAHEPRARNAGVTDDVIEAVRHGTRPDFTDPAEALVYEMVDEVVDNRRLGDELYARAVETLGEAAVVELVVLIGFYISIAVLLVSYDVEVPNGNPPLPELP